MTRYIDFPEKDRRAFDLAVKASLTDSTAVAEFRQAMKDKVAPIDIAIQASFRMQMETLRLEPSETPPCFVDLGAPLAKSDLTAAVLLRRMLKLGISAYHPDPMKAIEAAEAKLT